MPPASVRDELASVRDGPAGVCGRVVPKRLPHARAWGNVCGRPTMTLVTLYSTPDCHLCVEARAVLLKVQADLPFELCECDITTDEALHRAYFERIPVVALDDQELFEYFIHEDYLRERLEAIL